jgi:hypothetical protein
MARPAQVVLFDPGPRELRSNSKPGTVLKRRNARSGSGWLKVRSRRSPELPVAGLPAALVSVVPPATTKALGCVKNVMPVRDMFWKPAPLSMFRSPTAVADALPGTMAVATNAAIIVNANLPRTRDKLVIVFSRKFSLQAHAPSERPT